MYDGITSSFVTHFAHSRKSSERWSPVNETFFAVTNPVSPAAPSSIIRVFTEKSQQSVLSFGHRS